MCLPLNSFHLLLLTLPLFVSLFIQDNSNENTLLCNVHTRVLVVGDLKVLCPADG